MSLRKSQVSPASQTLIHASQSRRKHDPEYAETCGLMLTEKEEEPPPTLYRLIIHINLGVEMWGAPFLFFDS